MKELLINLAIYASMIALMAADEFYKIEYAGNLAIFVAWFFIVFGFISLASDPKNLFKDEPTFPALVKTGQLLMVGFMIMIGWTFTGLFYLTAILFLNVKKSLYKDEIKNATTEQKIQNDK